MRTNFGRRRRGGRGDGRNDNLDVEALLGRLVSEGVVPALSLTPLENAEAFAGMAAVGRGESESGTPILAAVAPRAAGDALLVALAAFAHEQATQEGFVGEVYAVAPVWASSARRLLGLVGQLPVRLHAVTAPVFAEGAEEVEPEPLGLPAVMKVQQIAGQLRLPAERALFDRATQALGGLATKHGGVLRGAEGALEVILQGRRVAVLRVDEGGVALESLVPRRSSERLEEEKLSGILDRLEGQLRKVLNDKRARDGEDGLRALALAKTIQAGQIRDIVPWPLGGTDMVPLDFAGVAEDGRPVVGAIRKQLDLAVLGKILDALVTIRPFLPMILEDAGAPLRIDAPRLWLASPEFTPGVLGLFECLNLDLTRIRIESVSGRDIRLLAEGESEAAPARERQPRPQRDRSRPAPSEGPPAQEAAGDAIDKGFQEISGFDLQEEPRPARGRGRGRGRGRRSGGRSANSGEDAPQEGKKDSDFQEVSSFDLEIEEETGDRSRRRGRGRRDESRRGDGRGEAGTEERDKEPKRTQARGRSNTGKDSKPGAQDGGSRLKNGKQGSPDSDSDREDDEDFFESLSSFDPELLESGGEAAKVFEIDEREEGESSGARKQREREARRLEREAKKQAAAQAEVAAAKAKPRRAAILVHNDRDSLIAGILLARDIRLLEGFWVHSQEELMTFFRSVVTDLNEKTPIYLIGFKASPARDLIQTASLYKDRLVWFDHHEWPPEDLQQMRLALGEDAVHVVPGAESALPAVVALCDRRSRFSDKLVDLATGRFSEHDFEHWGRLWLWRIDEIASKTGDRRAEIEPLLAGRPSDLSKEAALLALPPQPPELAYIAGRDSRLVHFGGYGLAVGEVPVALNLHLTGRIMRTRYQAQLSLNWQEGGDLLVLSAEDSGSGRSLDCVGMAEHLADKLDWVMPLDDGDHVARFRIADFQTNPDRLDEVLSEIAMGRSILEG